MLRSIRGWIIVVGIVLAGATIVILRWPVHVPSDGPVDPSRPDFKLEFPSLVPTKERSLAFQLPEELQIPPRAVIHLEGSIRGDRELAEFVIAELRTTLPDGSASMIGNALTRIELSPDRSSNFNFVIHYRKGASGPARLELRLGDEYLATARLKMSP